MFKAGLSQKLAVLYRCHSATAHAARTKVGVGVIAKVSGRSRAARRGGRFGGLQSNAFKRQYMGVLSNYKFPGIEKRHCTLRLCYPSDTAHIQKSGMVLITMIMAVAISDKSKTFC